MRYAGKIICVLTGTSSGFGQAVCQLIVKQECLLRNAKQGSHIVLLSRNIDGIEETKSLMKLHGFNLDRFTINVLTFSLDDSCQTEAKLTEFLKSLPDDFDEMIVFNNAGSLADISTKILDYQWSINEFQKYFNLNVVSSIYLLTTLLHRYSDCKCVVVQTSSLAAVKCMPYMPLYCAAKSTMDMFMKCLTLDHPTVKTLNYAPGPLDTKMGLEMKNKNGSAEIRSTFAEMFETGTIIAPLDSASKLMKLLEKMDFESGSHIDYFDV
jgi:Dehydrogenases with different specificities (related to short-chain alcohol dehydrogenases)